MDKNKEYIRLVGADWSKGVNDNFEAGQIHRVTSEEDFLGWVEFYNDRDYANINSKHSTSYRAEYVPVTDPEHPDFRDPPPTLVIGDEGFATGGFVLPNITTTTTRYTRVLVEKGETVPKTVVLLSDGTWLEVKDA